MNIVFQSMIWLLEDDKLWIQQRSNEKKIFPGLWGTIRWRRYKW